MTRTTVINHIALGRTHARRLRDIYRSAGWPCQDSVEVELLAAGLLERLVEPSGHDKVRLTDTGITFLAQAFYSNRQARSAHEALVDRVAQQMLRDGRIVWTDLSIRARLPTQPDEKTRWKICMPDVFSIRNTTVAGYLEPVVHEIKVSRADLLGDLKSQDKRDSYLDAGGQCWYVLGCDRKGKPIAEADEIPVECGVMILQGDRLEVARNAPKRAVADLPFALWMVLAKSTPLRASADMGTDGPDQSMLTERDPDVPAEPPP
ncbi:MAG: hypothetical protein Q7T69_14595 [Rhodoferax sp.]|nr:hypothetical protein [Rhodoferax sp.]